MVIIGISGRAGSGKDTVADFIISELQARGYSVEKYSMAKPLKDIAKYVFGLTDEDVNTQEGKKAYNKNCYGKSNREILQLVGTECFRGIFHDNVWIDFADRYTKKRAEGSRTGSWSDTNPSEFPVDIFVVPDIRYENESIWAKQNGFVIQINRPGLAPITESSHTSEQLLGINPNFILDNVGDLNYLKSLISESIDSGQIGVELNDRLPRK